MRQIERGNAGALWLKLEESFGLSKSTETIVAMLDQLKYIKKLKNETIEIFISRVDQLVSDLKREGEEISDQQRKYYVLCGLEGLDEWNLDVSVLRKDGHDKAWSLSKFDQYPISAENSRKLTAVSEKQKQSLNEDAHYVGNNYNRGNGYGGRGGFNPGRGRGRGNFTPHNNQNNRFNAS